MRDHLANVVGTALHRHTAPMKLSYAFVVEAFR